MVRPKKGELMLEFGGRVALVTGAGAGMGRSYARMLAARGARVVVNDIVAADARDVRDAIIAEGGVAVADYHDVSTSSGDIVAAAVDSFGRLDIVIANAGILRLGAFGEQPAEEFGRIFNVSFTGTIELSRAAWPHLAESGSGRLILIASSGMLGSPGSSAYGAAKGGIWGFGNSVAFDGEQSGIRVSTILPTAWTPMAENTFADPVIVRAMQETMAPDHVAAFVTYLAHQDTALHGHTFQVSAGHVSRIVVAGLPRVRVETTAPEDWVAVAPRLEDQSTDLQVYRATGEQFVAELVAADPSLAAAFGSGNPADVLDR